MAKKKKLPPIEVCATMRTLHEIETRAPNTHEGDNAKTALDRMLAKHGLARADIPDILAELEDDPRYATQRDPQPAQAADDRHPDEMRVNCLALLLRVIETHLYMPSPHERLAVALWCLHSHLIGRFEHSPRLAITSPVRRCGKTTLMKILELVCARATRFVDPSVAGLRQTLTEDEATLLIDEGDNLGLLKDRSMRSFLHDGFERGSYVLRGGLHGRPIRIPIHAAAAVACISKSSLSLPLLDRSVPIKMRRRPRSSPRLERFNRYNPVFPAARRQIEYWTRDAKLNLDPELPDQMDDRAQDCWRVLIASADDLGMGAEAREAAIALSISREACDPVIMLLRGIRRAFGHADRIWTDVLAAELENLGFEWTGMKGNQPPRPIKQSELTHLLNVLFEVEAGTLWPTGPRSAKTKPRKGYYYKQFEEIFESYSPDDEADADMAAAGKVVHIGHFKADT
jgi:hypothetical protein